MGCIRACIQLYQDEIRRCPKWVNKEFYMLYSIEKRFVFFNLAYMIKVSAKAERTLRSR